MPKSTPLFCFVILLLALSGCSDKTLSKEEQIRQFIASGVGAAEDRNHSDLVELVDPAYRDQKGFNKPQLAKLLRAYFFRHKNIFLLTKIKNITFPAEDEARVNMHVAMAGSVISDANALANLRARIYQFDLVIVKTETWQLKEASWQSASIADMQ